MAQSHILQGLALFAIAFGAHWVSWRLFGLPRAPILALSIHFLMFALAYCAWQRAALNSFGAAAALLLYAALCCAYVQSFPLALLLSPSLQLLLELEKAGPEGRTHEQLRSRFETESLFSRRIEELLRAGMIRLRRDGSLEARWRGRLSVPLFLVMRRLLGLPTGAG